MTRPLSLLGVVHTAISLLPVGAALYSFFRFGGIKPETRSGRIYLGGLALSVITAFGLSSTGGLNPGHLLGVVALVAASSTPLVSSMQFLGRTRPYLSTFALSFSFFLLLVPGIAETVTRLPAGHAFASGPQDPVVARTLLSWLVIFIIGFALQAWALRRGRPVEVRS
jgi:hypothetical protein